MEQNQKPSAANYHQAGHAVVAILYNIEFDEVNRDSGNENKLSPGPLNVRFVKHSLVPSFPNLTEELMFILAGITAEKKAYPFEDILLDDIQIAGHHALFNLANDKEYVQKEMSNASRLTEELFAKDEIWAKVELIASHLSTTGKMQFADVFNLVTQDQFQ